MRRLAVCRSVVVVLMVGSVTVACGDDGPSRSTAAFGPHQVERKRVAPEERAVVVSTRPCGDASSREGSGVIVSPGVVVTAAHVVADSREVSVRARSVDRPADVAVLDLDADIAVLDVPDGSDVDPQSPVELSRFVRDQTVRLIGASESGTVDLVVSRPVRIDIAGRRLGERVERDGYELMGVTADGDSGAGVYDAEGRLGGLVFARSDERADVAFAVEASEIREALEQQPATYLCDAERSALVPDES